MRTDLRRLLALAGLAAALALTWTPTAMAHHTRTYEVTIKDLTSGQPLTPPVVATHRGKGQLFEVGSHASFGVKEIAENGNNQPLLDALSANGHVSDFVQAGSGPLVPAQRRHATGFSDTVTFTIDADRRANHLSFVSMLICTNDGFTGVNSLKLPRHGNTAVASTVGYDAGTETNTEDFGDIVPPCPALSGVSSSEPGTGTSNPALAEGNVIRLHPGIKGIGDLIPGIHGWHDPVAEIKVKQID
jgi:hypothetical protein